MSLHAGLTHYLESVIVQMDVQGHPYFNMLASGDMSKAQFLESQIEFVPLAQAFNWSTAQAIAHTPDALLRMVLIDSLRQNRRYEAPGKAHGKTILNLIDCLGGNSAQIHPDQISPNIRIFNEAIRGTAAFENYRFTAAMFGGIERIFVDVSAIICKAMIDQQWLPTDHTPQYSLHAEPDRTHTEYFLQAVNDDWDIPVYQTLIREGIEFGANLLLNVYTGLYHHAVMWRANASSPIQPALCTP